MQETSVLFSLRELRGLERDRRADEERVARNAEAARIAEAAALAQRRAEAIASAARAEREEQLRIAQAREAAERDARIRVEHTEASERARHQAELEHARLVQELELRRAEVAKKRPTWMLVITGVAVVAAGALIWFAMQRQHDSEMARAQTEAAQREQATAVAEAREARTRLERLEQELVELDGRVKDAMRMVGIAQTNADRDAANKHLVALQREEADKRARIAADKAVAEHLIRLKPVVISDECKNSSLSKKCLDSQK